MRLLYYSWFKVTGRLYIWLSSSFNFLFYAFYSYISKICNIQDIKPQLIRINVDRHTHTHCFVCLFCFFSPQIDCLRFILDKIPAHILTGGRAGDVAVNEKSESRVNIPIWCVTFTHVEIPLVKIWIHPSPPTMG